MSHSIYCDILKNELFSDSAVPVPSFERLSLPLPLPFPSSFGSSQMKLQPPPLNSNSDIGDNNNNNSNNDNTFHTRLHLPFILDPNQFRQRQIIIHGKGASPQTVLNDHTPKNEQNGAADDNDANDNGDDAYNNTLSNATSTATITNYITRHARMYRCLNFNADDDNNDGDRQQPQPQPQPHHLKLTPINRSSQSQFQSLLSHAEYFRREFLTPKYMQKNAMVVLDAPQILDDFYADVLDWSQTQNIIAIALSDALCLYDVQRRTTVSCVRTVNMMGDGDGNHRNHKRRRRGGERGTAAAVSSSSSTSPNITAVKFLNPQPNGQQQSICIGTDAGVVVQWDVQKQTVIQCIRSVAPDTHTGILEWSPQFNRHCICCASKMSTLMMIHDLRQRQSPLPSPSSPSSGSSLIIPTPTKLVSLKWSPNSSFQFAVGGRDRCVSIFDARNLSHRRLKLEYHTASIRALCWSPHESDVLVSGGGSADRKICFWDLKQQTASDCSAREKCATIRRPFKCIRTASQVCNLLFDPLHKHRLLSSHGYQTNDILLWNTRFNQLITKLNGHTNRVLFLALAPDQQHIATASKDETLRLWKVFGDGGAQMQNNNKNRNKNNDNNKHINDTEIDVNTVTSIR